MIITLILKDLKRFQINLKDLKCLRIIENDFKMILNDSKLI